MKIYLIAIIVAAVFGSSAVAQDSLTASITASDQTVANGVISAETVMAPANGWMVAHRTDAGMAPGPVVGYAPLRKGENSDVAAILQDDVAPGDMLMLMVHSEERGMAAGVFEYTLGATEDGPVRMDDELVTAVVTAE
jgi:hypothetical protein